MRLLLLFPLLVLAGCSTVSTRIKERPQVFHSLTPKQQQLVLQGEVVEGLTKDAVYLAWGRPDEVARGSEKGHSFEEWIYEATESEIVTTFSPTLRYYGRYHTGLNFLDDPVVETRSYPYKSIRFENGLAVAWRIAPLR